MSIQTSIKFLNENDPDFVKAKNGTDKEKEEWEEFNGSFFNRPGAKIEDEDDGVHETDDEYGGFVIELKSIPKNATHIVVFRS